MQYCYRLLKKYTRRLDRGVRQTSNCTQCINRFTLKNVDVHLNNPDQKFNSILNSPFTPGRWVKRVCLQQITAPEVLEKIDPANDRLFQLIKHTPKVKEVSAYPDLQNISWKYLTIALMETDNWKLQKIPDPPYELADNSTYFNCAYHVRNTLTELRLTRGMIGRTDFGRLAEFKQLLELTVGNNVLKDMYDCSSLLKYLFQLEVFRVGGFQMSNSLELERADTNDTSNSTSKFNNLKLLYLFSYHPSRGDELHYIMDNYTVLDCLGMVGTTGTSCLHQQSTALLWSRL